MNLATVYLAGPIAGLSFDGAQDWRDRARGYFSQRRVDALSPLRDKEYLRTQGELNAGDYGAVHILSAQRSIMCRDFFDATRCDLLFVNFVGAARVSMGTVMEIGWCYQKRTPIVCAMEPGNVHEHAMVLEAIDYRVSTLDEALAIACSVLAV